MIQRFTLALALALLTATGGVCGPLLEEILNGLQLDQRTSARDEQRFCTIEPGQAVGQTFVVSDGVEQVFRIAVWQAFWHETWQPDEVLVMTLWDSPQKKTAYGRFGIPYARRMWEGAVPMFTLEARVPLSPDRLTPRPRPYYFELTVEVEPPRPAVLPREWLLAGQRPGFAGGDGKLVGIGIARDDYPQGQAYVGGAAQDFDLWFETHVRRRADRDALYREAFERFDLDRPGLEPVREAVQKQEWEQAAQELVRHFEGRADLIPPDKLPQYDPDFDTREADLAGEQRHLLPDGTTVDLGPNWNHFALWPERGGVGLTRSGLRKVLAQAYARTGNEKYARAFNDMLTQLFIHCPSPLRAGVFSPEGTVPAALPPGLAGGSMWSGLSIGARMGHGFAYYAWFVKSPCFTPDVRAAFILNLGEMAEALERMKGGGNWETQMADSLFDFGLTYPEFKRARAWVQQGLQTLIDNARSTVRPDGVLQEPTMNYHLLVMGRYASVIERVRELGLQVPDEMVQATERMFEYVMYSALPDSTLPVWGDANPPIGVDALERGAVLFQRDDFRFVATKGTQGTPPPATSVGFPHGGFYYLRTGWQPNAHYLGVHCGPHGSHGHLDALGLIVCAHGRLVLIDPGVYTYGTPESQELSSTSSHNTVTVDGRDVRGGGQADGWETSDRFDFFAGHNEGYRGLEEVRHHRRIWFLKPFNATPIPASATLGTLGTLGTSPGNGHPGLGVVLDDVVGEGGQREPENGRAGESESGRVEEHEAQLRFRFAPLSVQHDPANLRVWTSSSSGLAQRPRPYGTSPATGGNLLVQGVERGQAKMELSQGIAAADWSSLTQVPVVCFRRQGQLPFSFTSLLIPFQGETPPPCGAKFLVVHRPSLPTMHPLLGEEARAVWVRMGDDAVLVVANGLYALQEEPEPLQLKMPDGRPMSVVAAGLALRFVRQDDRWQPVSLDGVRLRAVSLDGQSLLGRDQANVLHSFPASSLTPRHGPNCSRPAQRPPAC